ncbi:phosphate ABC transporter permease PstA [soil metagenome]
MSQASDSLYNPRRRQRDWAGRIFGVVCFLATLIGVVVLVLLLGSLVARIVSRQPDLPWQALMDHVREFFAFLVEISDRFGSRRPERAGFKAGIAGTLWLLGLVAITAIPIGVGAAIFLEEYAPPGRLRSIIQTNISNLAGVPSIVYGILGLTLFVRGFGFKALGLGPILLAGALTLSLLILPIVVIASQEALRAVPISLRQAAMALGATRWQVIRDHVLPSALPGIMTGTILALSRAIGETAPLLMVGAAASIRWVPDGPFDRYTALPVEIYNYAKEPNVDFQIVAAGGILILLAILMSMNAIAIIIRNRSSRQ